MSSRMRIWGACRTLALRTRPATEPFFHGRSTARFMSNDGQVRPPNDTPASNNAAQSTQNAQENTVEDPNASSTSPADVLDDATLEQMFYGGRMATSQVNNGAGGLTQAQENALYQGGTILSPEEAEALEASGQLEGTVPVVQSDSPQPFTRTHKFPLPVKPYPDGYHLKKRYHPVLDQMVRIIMVDGKLSLAQKHMTVIMNHLRTSPAPIYSPSVPLLPGTPPASHLPLNPVLYLTIAVDSVAPLAKILNVAKAAGGGRALEVPQPLPLRARRRTAFKWIMDAVAKRPSLGSGRKQLGTRIAEEIIAVVEGRSGVWDRRRQIHKVVTANRVNMVPQGKKRLGGRKLY